MRRVRHLGICNYIVPVGRNSSQPLALSNYNIILERTWHRQNRDDYKLQAHVKFNADAMNGIQISCFLLKGSLYKSFEATEFKIFRLAEASWSETLVTTVVPTELSPVQFTTTVNQATLGLNELSGMETYSLEVTAIRKRRRITAKFWFNHLGVFDSLWMAKREIELLNLSKLDE